tara:strand:- start:146 stop:460 length:315 start_codon:yes stop_codon:yes gene_type:complete
MDVNKFELINFFYKILIINERIVLINKGKALNQSDILTFHGNFDKENNKVNILLLLPKTRGSFGITKFKKLIEKNLIYSNMMIFDLKNQIFLTTLIQLLLKKRL